MNHDDANRSNIMNYSAPRESKKRPRISVSLSERDHVALTKLAERHDVSISWAARQALAEFIEKYEDTQARLPLHIKNPNANG